MDNNQGLVIGNSWYVDAITVTTTATSLATLMDTASSVRGSKGNTLQITLTPAGDISIKEGKNGNAITLASGVAKTFPILDVENQLLLSCASGTVACTVEYIRQERMGRA